MTKVLPPLALMGLIFYLSAQPHVGPDLGTLDILLRKAAHMAEYGLLWLLLMRAFDYEKPWHAFGIAFAYACSDEFHQTFVDGRNGTPVDVAIDTAGMAVAALALRASRAR